MCSILPPLMLIKRQGWGMARYQVLCPLLSFQSSRGSSAGRSLTIQRRTSWGGSFVLELPDSSCGGRERTLRFLSRGKHGQRFPGKHTSEQPCCHAVWALRGKTPEHHTASAPAAHQLRRAAALRFICFIFSSRISLRFWPRENDACRLQQALCYPVHLGVRCPALSNVLVPGELVAT